MPFCHARIMSPAPYQMCKTEDRRKRQKLGTHTPANTTTLNKEATQFIREVEKKRGDLTMISDFVKKNMESRLPVGKGGDIYVRICDLNGTMYMGQTHMLESWQELYFNSHKKMEVLGTLESTDSMPPFPQWIVLVGEDGCVYAYEDEEIYLFANSLNQLVQEGIKKTGKTFKYPKHIAEEDEEVLQQDKDIQKIRQETKDFVNKSAEDFEDFLNFLDS